MALLFEAGQGEVEEAGEAEEERKVMSLESPPQGHLGLEAQLGIKSCKRC